MNYEHHAVDSPYRMRFAILVRAGEATFDQVDTVPEQPRSRMPAVRAFDAAGMMVAFELAKGATVEQAIERPLGDGRAAYPRIHVAAPGCCAAKVVRA